MRICNIYWFLGAGRSFVCDNWNNFLSWKVTHTWTIHGDTTYCTFQLNCPTVVGLSLSRSRTNVSLLGLDFYPLIWRNLLYYDFNIIFLDTSLKQGGLSLQTRRVRHIALYIWWGIRAMNDIDFIKLSILTNAEYAWRLGFWWWW